jgi:hypothetical protein
MAAPRAPPGDSLFTADGALIATTVKIVLLAGPTQRNPEFPGLGVVVTVAVRTPLGSSSKRTLLGSITSMFTASGPAGLLSGIVTGPKWRCRRLLLTQASISQPFAAVGSAGGRDVLVGVDGVTTPAPGALHPASTLTIADLRLQPEFASPKYRE